MKDADKHQGRRMAVYSRVRKWKDASRETDTLLSFHHRQFRNILRRHTSIITFNKEVGYTDDDGCTTPLWFDAEVLVVGLVEPSATRRVYVDLAPSGGYGSPTEDALLAKKRAYASKDSTPYWVLPRTVTEATLKVKIIEVQYELDRRGTDTHAD